MPQLRAPPLPPIADPFKNVDRLPQPFRMIDKIVAEIVEKALEMCLAKDKQKRVTEATHIDTVISPHALVIASGQASCFTTLGVGGMVIVGTLSGDVMSHTARDPMIVGRAQHHSTAVTALDIGHVAATGTKVVVSASKTRLVVHDVILKSGELRNLAQTELPQDPDLPAGEFPAIVNFSPNAGHVAVCWPSGPVAVYEVLLPAPLYESESADRPPDAPPLDLTGGTLKLALHFPMRVLHTLLVGNLVIGQCNVVWQQQQRPDKTGRSDRNHRPAKGVYMWWKNCNKLALTYLDAVEKGGKDQGLKLPPICPAAAAPAPPATPPGKATKGKDKVAAPVTPDPATQTGSAALSAEKGVIAVPSKGWLLPMGITHSCCSENGKMLAFGMNDGSTLVWDDHFGGLTRILPRMRAPVAALAFVNGAPNLLFVTSTDGSVYLADLNKPEDSHLSKTRLPHAAHQVYFLPNDPFAVCVCYGDDVQTPRLVWFNMQDEKLAAELSGKDAKPDNLMFGRAGLRLPLPSQTGGTAGSGGNPGTDGAAVDSTVAATPKASAATPKGGNPGNAKPNPVVPARAEATGNAQVTPAVSDQQPSEEVLAQLQEQMEARPWPVVSFRDSYLVAGGPLVVSATYRPPEDGSPPPHDSDIPKDAHLYLYKIDAIARMLLPEEMANAASKSLLNRMLADLNPPKIRRSRVKMGLPDPDAPKPPPSAMRKARDIEPDEEMGGRRHIKFNEADLEGLLNEEQKGKTFKKETIKGGYSDGKSRQITDSGGGGSGLAVLPGLNLGTMNSTQSNVPSYMQERPQSPPWHHTNPLARIHPDWEEAGVLARMMEKLGSKGGGRRRRERRLGTVAREMQGKMAREQNPKPALLQPVT